MLTALWMLFSPQILQKKLDFFSYTIVKEHGGLLEFESNQGKGSVAKLTFQRIML